MSKWRQYLIARFQLVVFFLLVPISLNSKNSDFLDISATLDFRGTAEVTKFGETMNWRPQRTEARGYFYIYFIKFLDEKTSKDVEIFSFRYIVQSHDQCYMDSWFWSSHLKKKDDINSPLKVTILDKTTVKIAYSARTLDKDFMGGSNLYGDDNTLGLSFDIVLSKNNDIALKWDAVGSAHYKDSYRVMDGQLTGRTLKKKATTRLDCEI